jgi:hypothetical protein
MANGTVLLAITLVVLPIAAVAFARSGGAWRRIGKGEFAIEQELPPQAAAGPAAVDRVAQEAEARQMLEAKSYRRVQSGLPPLDVDAEVKQLLAGGGQEAPSIDAELRDEVRRLVIAGNERRMRCGEEPLDVEAETERQLANFVGSG